MPDLGLIVLQMGRHWPWLWPLLGAVSGAVVGCFLSCAAVRLPLGQSLRRPVYSQCDTCHMRLTLPDLMPLFSWLLLRGRCRHCGSTYGVHNLLWEVAFTALGALLGWVGQPGPATPLIIVSGLLGICLLTCAVLQPTAGKNMHKHHIPGQE